MIATHRAYSAAENRIIRDRWPDLRAAASELGRTFYGVRNQAAKLGMTCPSGVHKRPFTEAERSLIRERYPAEGAIPVAAALDRKIADIVSCAGRMGVGCDMVRRWTAEEDQLLTESVKRGILCREIAGRLNRTYYAVLKRREVIGLAAQQPNRLARRSAARILQRPDRGGSKSRWAKARIALGEHGWPPDLNPKEISVLNVLLERGPLTRRNLSNALGEPACLAHKHTLRTHNGQSCMTRLRVRGLVTTLNLQDRRKRLSIFTLTANAVAMRGNYGSVHELNAHAACVAKE